MKKYITLGCLLTAFNLFCSDWDDKEFQTINDFLSEPTPSGQSNISDEFEMETHTTQVPKKNTIRKKLDEAGLTLPNFNSMDPYMTLGIDYYNIINMNDSARKDYITKIYSKLSQIFDPDKNPEDREVNEERFKKISEAYRKIKASGYTASTI